MAQLKNLGRTFARPWGVAASNVPETSALNIDRGTFWDPRSIFTTIHRDCNGRNEHCEDQYTTSSLWNGHDHHGLMTLAGDAAHPMLPRTILLLLSSVIGHVA